jgi:hypothetical protein
MHKLLIPCLVAFFAISSSALAGGVKIAPSTLDVRARAGQSLPPVTFTNGTGRTLDVRAIAVPVSEGLDGMPVYSLSRAAREAGRRLVSLPRSTFTARPGASIRLRPRVGRPPHGRVGAYAAIVFLADPVGIATAKKGGTLVPRIRVAANVLIRFPGRVVRRGSVESLHARQGRGRTLDFVARLHNTGNLHVRAPGTLRVRRVGGREVLRAPIEPSMVLPKTRRDLTATVRKLLPAGSYEAVVQARFGDVRARRATTFRLVGPNRLPTAEATIGQIAAPGARPDERFDVTFDLESTGTAPLSGSTEVVLTPIGGGSPSVLPPVALAGLAPGHHITARTRAPGLLAGVYRVDVTATSGGFATGHASDQIEIRAAAPSSDRLRAWLAEHMLAVIAALAALALLSLAAAVVAVRRARTGPAGAS